MKTQLLRFGMVGVAGYVVDALVLYLMMAAGMGFLRGRLVSFVCAVLATFVLNRRYTFAEQLRSSAQRPPLWLEFGRYLAAMALGGLLNLATYWFILKVTPHFPALYALAIGAGSLVGMTANFASARWWVFIHRPEHGAPALPRFELTTVRCLVLVQAVFWTAHLTELNLPGLYQDAVNPDYLAAQALNPELANPVWMQPTIGFPVLGSLYHGVQNFYVGLPVFALFGFNMFALRVAQGLFAGGVLVMAQLVLQRVSGSRLLALAGALGLATELAFIASFRTQMYIIVSGAFWLLLATYLALGRGTAASPTPVGAAAIGASGRHFALQPTGQWLLSGLCFGLAVYSYFVFLFFLPVFVVPGLAHTRHWRPVLVWLLGVVAGMQTYVLGYTLAALSLGGIEPFVAWLVGSTEGLGPMSSELDFMGRVANAWFLTMGTLQNVGNELMIFGTDDWWPTGTWILWKSWLLVLAAALLVIIGILRGRKLRGLPDAAPRTGSLLAPWHLAMLPFSFFAVSLIFGSRLWAHHFSQLVPLAYVILFIVVYELQTLLRMALPRWVAVALMALLIGGNLYQQRIFFERLETTGGAGTFSNALNRLADDALALPSDIVHVFPEWGFGMPFALLTGNRRSYEDDVDDTTLQRLAAAGSTVRLYYWEAANETGYRDRLLAQGFRINSGGTYLQRDGNIAFYWIEASPGAR